MAHNDNRNPMFSKALKGWDTTGVSINNVVYNWESRGAFVSKDIEPGLKIQVSIVGNVFIEGADTDKQPIWIDYNSNIEVYLSNNTKNRVLPNDPWDIAEGSSPQGTKVSSAPIWISGFNAMPVSHVENYVLNHAGARPADRDSVDNRIVNDVINGTGRIIDSQKEVGGWPSLAKNYRTLSIPANPHVDSDGDGYTNLEEWLHAYSAEVEGNGSAPDPSPGNVPNPPSNLRIIN
jgi:hypothetical protein